MRNRFPALYAALTVFALGACSGSTGGGAATGTPADEQAIRDLAGKYAAAYSKHDTTALGALVTDDYEDVDATGAHTQGRAGFESVAAKEFAMMPAGMATPMSATTTYVRWLNGTTAVAGGTWQVTGGMPGMPNKGSWMAVAVKKDSTWKMMSALGASDMSGMAMPDTAKPKKPMKGKGK